MDRERSCSQSVGFPLFTEDVMSTLLIVLLVLFVLGGGGWGYSRYRR
jgi:hypothetical protein